MSLTPDEIATFRAQLEAWMTDTGQIWRPGRGRNAGGGVEETPTLVATSKCRIRPDRKLIRERDEQGKMVAIQGWRITFPAGTDVTEKDHIIPTGGPYTTQQFEVSGVHGPKTDELSRQAVCLRVS